MTSNVLAVIVAAVASTALWAIVVQVRSIRMLRARRREVTAHDDALTVLIDVVVGGRADLGNPVRRLTSRGQAAVLSRLATSIEGRELERLRHVATEFGAVDRARDQLDDRRWWKRLAAVALLAALSIDDPAQAALLDDPHPLVRASAVRWLERTGLSPETQPRLIRLMADDDGLVRAATRDVLVAAGTVATPLLRAALAATSDPRIVREALEIIAVRPDVDLLDTALRWRGDDHPELRAATALLLARLGDRGELAVLLRDREADVRLATIRAVGAARVTTLSRDAGLALRDDDWRIRDAAIAALHELGAPGEIVLRREATRPHQGSR